MINASWHLETSFPKCAQKDTWHRTTVWGGWKHFRKISAWPLVEQNHGWQIENATRTNKAVGQKMCCWKTPLRCSLSPKWTEDDTGSKPKWPTKMFPAGLPCSERGQIERVAWCGSTWWDGSCLCLSTVLVWSGSKNSSVCQAQHAYGVWNSIGTHYQGIQTNVLNQVKKKIQQQKNQH